eukprot:s1143_g9.t1
MTRSETTEGEDATFKLRAMWMEINGESVDRKNLYDKVRDLTQGVIIMDTRGIYDSMVRNVSSLHGLRSSLAGYELTLAVQQAMKIRTGIRWVNGLAMLADCLTKANERKVFLQFLAAGQKWLLIHDERFVAGKKLRKRELEQATRDMELKFIGCVREMAMKSRNSKRYGYTRLCMTKLVESPAENIPVYTAYPKMLPYSMVYVQGMTGSGPMVWNAAGDSSCSEGSWWTPSMSSQQNPSMASMPNAAMAPSQSAATTMIPAMQMQMQNQQLQQALQQQALQMQLQQNAMQQTAMQQNAMQSMSTQMPQNTSQSSTSSMQVQQTQLQVPQLQSQMRQQMPLQNPQMTQMGQQPLQQLQQAPVQLPLQPLQQNQLAADSQEKGERKDLPRRPDRRKLINQSLPPPVVVEEPQPLAVPPSEEVSEKAPGKQRRRRKESGKSESSRFATLRGDLEHGGSEGRSHVMD